MSSPRSLSLDEFIALNEEIAALARAGIPLDRGLTLLGRDVRGRLGETAQSLGRRLEQGEPLEKVLADPAYRLPPLFQAVVAAGVRSGNLAVALQGLASAVRRTAEMRRIVGTALIYPAIVLLVTVGLFSFALTRLIPAYAEAHSWIDAPLSGVLVAVVRVADGATRWWAAALLILAAIAGLYWWLRSGRAARAQYAGRARLLGWLPTLGRLSRAGRLSSFAEVLRLLIEHRVPLAEALVLAADASGDGRLQTAAHRAAERLQRGEKFDIDDSGFPPMLAWLLAGGAPTQQLTSALDHFSRAYRHQALQMAQWLSVYLPLILTAGIGGTAVAAYALSVLGPAFHLVKEMGQL